MVRLKYSDYTQTVMQTDLSTRWKSCLKHFQIWLSRYKDIPGNYKSDKLAWIRAIVEKAK